MNIYYDMDNTLCLFSKKGREKEAMRRAVKPGYFINLKPIDSCIEALRKLVEMGYNVHILSACVPFSFCREEKRAWLKKYLPFIREENIIFCNAGDNKATYVTNIKGAILIDDYGKNIRDWMAAGGIAIKKSSSDKKRDIPVIRNHMDIFDILPKLLSA